MDAWFISVNTCYIQIPDAYLYVYIYICMCILRAPIHIEAVSFHNAIYASIILCRYVYLCYISFKMLRAYIF